MNNNLWLIWSIEHSCWWKPNRLGYTEKRAEAGRYTLEEAEQIVRDANIGEKDVPNEGMLPASAPIRRVALRVKSEVTEPRKVPLRTIEA